MRKALVSGVLYIEEYVFTCAVLDDGRQVIAQRSLKSIFPDLWEKQGTLLTNLKSCKNLLPYINKDMQQLFGEEIVFESIRGKVKHGYNAKVLPALCKLFSSAQRDFALRKNQGSLIEKFNLISSTLSQKGIQNAINEVTGFKAFESHLAAQKLENKKQFPDEFYIEICKLRGWQITQGSQRSRLFGNITNQLVYEALIPGFPVVLARMNPVNRRSGRRRYHHHQMLSEKIGQKHLQEHIVKLLVLMKTSYDWQDFMNRFKRLMREDNFEDDLKELFGS